MGCSVEVHAPAAQIAQATGIVERLFAMWDAALSRFRPSSELSALNRSAGRAFAASDLLFRVVEAALGWATVTDGTFDPTLLLQIERLGYVRTFDEIETGAPLAPLTEAIGPGGAWRAVVLDRGRRTIRLPVGCGVDLGGIAKGMAVDAALDALVAARIAPVLVNAGGDLAVRGLPDGSDAWPVAIASLPGKTIPLQRGGIATSGALRRRWLQGGAPRHHLLNPATGFPAASGLRTVTVVAPNCTEADVAATTAYLRGPQTGGEFLLSRGLAGLLIPETGSPIRIAPWPQE